MTTENTAESSFELLPGSLEIENNPAEKHVWNLLKDKFNDCSGMLGYRVLPLGNRNLKNTPSFIFISSQHGIFLIDICVDKLIKIDSEDYWIYENDKAFESRDVLCEYYEDEARKRLKRSANLYSRKNRSFQFPINRVIIFYENTDEELADLEIENHVSCEYFGSQNIEERLASFITPSANIDLSEQQISEIYSYLEGTRAFESRKLEEKQLVTVNDFIQKSLNVTFKQDKAQRQISLQLPNGPQRIRGLAGTGKTVVLALKSALTHLQFKDYKILYLFNTQSLYNQVERLVEEYYVPEAGAVPNWDNLNILHAWGGKSKPGLYFNLCEKYGLQPLTWDDVRGRGEGLSLIYQHLLDKVGDKIEEDFDMVLIDEAQDFPKELFEVVYKITKEPKRIIWAYDEFQSLKEIRIREPQDLFGHQPNGAPNISAEMLKGYYEGGILKDYILPNCYRNPRLTLMIAHGVALGLYRKDGMVDSIDTKEDWNALGYDVIKPEGKAFLEAGDEIEILRDSQHSQNRLENYIEEEGKKNRNLLQVKKFDNFNQQALEVSGEIVRLINTQEVPAEEIIVITLDTRHAEKKLAQIRSLLNQQHIQAITPGFVEKSSAFKEKGMVTLATPFRAKGNEGNVVFVIDCQRTIEDYNYRGRNSFFVSVTRSRGWCHLYGLGENMATLISEIDAITHDYPHFKFTRPDDETIYRRRVRLSKSDKEIAEAAAMIDKLIENDSDMLVEQLRIKGLIPDES